MVYIDSSGNIHQETPWGFQKLLNIFFGLINFIVFFFKTLVGMEAQPIGPGSSRSGSSSNGSGGHGGGGGGGGPFRPGGGGSKRFMTMKDVNPPTIGGCPGGSCGL